jgi:D-beta-D-heptose 7-phosphate kinase/D-beta-D-heptose 1-phosphate adenosyltransferase
MIIDDIETLISLIEKQHKKIVFTNGCFDLLHEGHLHLLKQAKSAGDRLIVAVNSDASVKKLKGDKRPVENLATRMHKLADRPEVDFVLAFDEETPLNIIRKILPHVLVKGGDYSEEQIVGAEEVKNAGGSVLIIPLLKGYSTTQIIRSGNN